MKVHRELLVVVFITLVHSCFLFSETGDKVHKQMKYRFEYDKNGRLTKVVDPECKEIMMVYHVDDMNRIQRIVRTSGGTRAVQYDFDRFGRRKEMTDVHGTVRYGYNGFGRLIKVERKNAPVVHYEYDTQDRLETVCVGDMFKVEYRYDFLGRLSKVNYPAGEIQYEYLTGQGKTIRYLPNGMQTIWSHKPDGSLESICHTKSNRVIIHKMTYQYGPEGRIAAIQERGTMEVKEIHYIYDVMGRVVEIRNTRGNNWKYDYNTNGDRIARYRNDILKDQYQYGWDGRITSCNDSRWLNNPLGSVTAYSDEKGLHAFHYNNDYHVDSVCVGKRSVKYYYDGDGYLLRRQTKNQRTDFLPDPMSETWRPLVITEEDSTRLFYIWEGDRPLLSWDGKTSRYFLHDHLGSIRLMVEGDEDSLNFKEYSPFGQCEIPGPDSTAHFGFAGLLFDPLTNLYMIRARAYDSGSGRFIQARPCVPKLIESGDYAFSDYYYASHDPVNYTMRDGFNQEPVNTVSFGPMNRIREWIQDLKIESISESKTIKIPEFIVGAQNLRTLYEKLKVSEQNSNWNNFGYNLNEHLKAVNTIPVQNWIPPVIVQPPMPAIPRIPYNLTIPSYNHTFHNHTLRIQSDINTLLQHQRMHSMAMQMNRMTLRNHELMRWSANQIRMQEQSRMNLNIMRQTQQNMDFARQTMNMHNMQRLHHLHGSHGPGGGPGPSHVGGIDFENAEKALRNIGVIKGITYDSKTDRMILKSQEKGEIQLPPLRLNDVVTIFKSVYDSLQAPFVTIDPNPKDPEGPIMLVRNNTCLKDTYVGWILFEADRMMKGYQLGQDNVTRKKIKSKVDGYLNYADLSLRYPDGEDSIWERFWIVPDTVRVAQSEENELTISDVTLKVKTQRMKLVNGQLIPADNDTPSVAAQLFAKWFTDNYDEIAEECSSLPPKGSGLNKSVLFFAELKRIAFVTALAERLRDQGVPMPTWMRDYHTSSCPITDTTPSLTVKKYKDKYGVRHSICIFGGVRLSTKREEVIENKEKVLETTAQNSFPPDMKTSPPVTQIQMKEDEEVTHLVTLPVNQTYDVAPCRLSFQDLCIPIPGGVELTIQRHFNSFFQPSGLFGRGWTLDLPRLNKHKIVCKETEDSLQYQIIDNLITPLKSCAATFKDLQYVPELQARLWVPNKDSNILGMGRLTNTIIGHQTRVIIFRDGTKWHFNDDGFLVANEQRPFLMIYRRDSSNRIMDIEGWYGKEKKAVISLDYDIKDRLVSANGSNEEHVSYSYDEDGNLSRVTKSEECTEYKYNSKGLIVSIIKDGQEIQSFSYDSCGRLMKELREDGNVIDYSITRKTDRIEVTSSGDLDIQRTVYNHHYRPVQTEFTDGSRALYEYKDSGESEILYRTVMGDEHSIVRSGDGMNEIWRLPSGAVQRYRYDTAGRIVGMYRGEVKMFEQEWRSGGLQGTIRTDWTAYRPRYSPVGVLGSYLITSPKDQERYGLWARVAYDGQGRIMEIADNRNCDIGIEYDDKGCLSSIESSQGFISIERKSEGTKEHIVTSWGISQTNSYDAESGFIQEEKVMKDEDGAVVRFHQGRPVKVQQFDGGEVEMAYYSAQHCEGFIHRIKLPDGSEFTCDYDKKGRLSRLNSSDQYEMRFKYNKEGRLAEMVHKKGSK